MNLSMNWLKDIINLDCDMNDFIERVTMSGSKVETVEYLAHGIKNVIVGKILKIDKHPNADKLVICKVDIGGKELQIVTGATNIFEGAYVPVAIDGAILSNDLKIKSGKLRGETSDGMLCSIEELGFTRNDYPEAPEDGIYIFEEEQKLGSDVVEVLQMKDEVVEFEITSNRPDCFSVMGLAREIAATYNTTWKKDIRTFPKEEADGNINEMIKVTIENPELCKRYIARVIKNVKIEPSPLWLRHRLTASGIRPINNIVDITNYVMLEMGQPMHAFDIDNVKDRHIIVRNAKDNETFMTLDEVERKLDSSMLVISDSEKAVAIAGIMGGENSKVTEGASAILLESACFEGTNVRLSAKKLGLRTDSSSKFEKNLDPNLAIDAVNRASYLIELLGCGEVVKGVVDNYPNKLESWNVEYSVDNINALLGTEISKEEMENILAKIEVDARDGLAKIPTFRPDLELEADIAEEVARFYGYDNIKTTLAGVPTIGKKSKKQIIEEKIRNIMTSNGLCEAMNYSFESPKSFEKLLIPENDKLREAVNVINPLGEDYSIMRTSTLNGMLQSLSTNYNRRNEEAKLFEIANIYLPKQLPLKELPEEKLMLTIGMYGEKDFYDIKGIIESLFENIGIGEIEYLPEKALVFMHPGRTANVFMKNEKCGYIGEVHPEVADNYSINKAVYIAVIDLNKIFGSTNIIKKFKPLAKFPETKRDISMTVKEDVLVKDIENIIVKNGGDILNKVMLFDVYQGEQIEKGFKSVAYNISFRATDRTLQDKEVNEIMKKILENLKDELDAQLRE